MGRVDQKIAIVTGGGNGIGRAIAERLAAEGAIVTVTDQNPAAGKVVADAVDNIQFLEHDVRVEADWAKVMDNVLQRHGRLDILINNAGILATESSQDVERKNSTFAGAGRSAWCPGVSGGKGARNQSTGTSGG